MNESSDQVSAAEARELSLDEIIAELDQPYTGKVPERALRAAQRRRAEITPRLVELLRAGIAEARVGRFRETDLHFLALLLLVEFQAEESLPLLLELCRLPDRDIDSLMGDTFYELLPGMLVGLSPHIGTVDALVSDRAVATYVRAAISNAYVYLVRDGKVSREETAEHLRKMLAQATAERDPDAATWILNALVDIGPIRAREEIDAAFRHGLIDRTVMGPDEVDEAIARGDAEFQEAVERARDTGIADTVELLKEWEREFGDPDESEPAPSSEVARFWEPMPDDVWDPGDDDPFKPSVPLHTAHKKVGRNELCPCGSGKKFKKCCGRH